MKSLPILNYRQFGEPSKITNIFLHGYLGSHKNFTNVSKYLSSQLNQRSIEIDMRNHGLSRPHVSNMTYHELSQDLARFITNHKLERVNLIGYSMGAKTILEYVLNPTHHPNNRSVINKIICMDNSPMKLDNLGAEFQRYIDIVKDAKQWADLTFNQTTGKKLPKDWKKQVLKYLEDFDHLNKGMCLYFLDLFHLSNNKVELKVSDYLLSQRSLEELNDFEDYSTIGNHLEIPSLFIKAKDSDFITTESWKMIRDVFPDSRLEVFESDHKSLLSVDPDRLKKVMLEYLSV